MLHVRQRRPAKVGLAAVCAARAPHALRLHGRHQPRRLQRLQQVRLFTLSHPSFDQHNVACVEVAALLQGITSVCRSCAVNGIVWIHGQSMACGSASLPLLRRFSWCSQAGVAAQHGRRRPPSAQHYMRSILRVTAPLCHRGSSWAGSLCVPAAPAQKPAHHPHGLDRLSGAPPNGIIAGTTSLSTVVMLESGRTQFVSMALCSSCCTQTDSCHGSCHSDAHSCRFWTVDRIRQRPTAACSFAQTNPGPPGAGIACHFMSVDAGSNEDISVYSFDYECLCI